MTFIRPPRFALGLDEQETRPAEFRLGEMYSRQSYSMREIVEVPTGASYGSNEDVLWTR